MSSSRIRSVRRRSATAEKFSNVPCAASIDVANSCLSNALSSSGRFIATACQERWELVGSARRQKTDRQKCIAPLISFLLCARASRAIVVATCSNMRANIIRVRRRNFFAYACVQRRTQKYYRHFVVIADSVTGRTGHRPAEANPCCCDSKCSAFAGMCSFAPRSRLQFPR